MNKLFESCELTPYGDTYAQVAPARQGEKDYVELILLKEGGARKNTAFYGEQVSLPAIMYIPQGVNDKFIPDDKARGYIIRFKNEFLPANKVDLFATFFDSCNLPLHSFVLQGTVTQLFKMILCEYMADSVDAKSIQYLLLSLLAKVDFVRKDSEGKDQFKERDYLVCKTFLRLLEENFVYNHKVDFYSRQLNVSLRSLNYMTTRVLGKSVLQLIDMRKHTEARKLLVNSSKSITEIAYELGFDKSYFSRFFYKKTGMTPMQFRQVVQNTIS